MTRFLMNPYVYFCLCLAALWGGGTTGRWLARVTNGWLDRRARRKLDEYLDRTSAYLKRRSP